LLQRSTIRYTFSVLVSDLLLTFLALVVARGARMAIPVGQSLTVAGSTLYWPMFAMAGIIWTVTLASFKAYDPQRMVRWSDEAQTVTVAVGVSTVIFAGTLYFTYRGLSRLLFVYFFLFDVCFCLAARFALRRAFGRRPVGQRAVLIVGAGVLGQRLARSLLPCRWMGIDVQGYLDDDEAKVGQTFEGVPVLGTLDQANGIVAERDVREVIIALPMSAHGRLATLVARLSELPVNIKVVPDYSQLVFLRTTLETFGGELLVGLKEPVIGPVDRLIKRAFDLIVAGIGIVLLSPVLVVIALLVRVSSPGAILYGSQRVGEGGRVFGMLKFRTMYVGADRDEGALISETEQGNLVFDKREDDPRITPIGRFLRRYSLDELPQLCNVLVGDMSLVGPRPELPSLVKHYKPWQMKRFAVPQGITGWWQISGRSSKAKHLHVEDDLYYIRNYSILLDVRILLRTPEAVIRGEGAF